MKTSFKYKKFLSVGLFSAMMMFGACSKFEGQEVVYELNQGQSSVELVVGKYFSTDLYRVKEPIDVYFKPPKNSKFLINEKLVENHIVHIKPQESIDLLFTVVDNDDKNSNTFEVHVNTFKEDFKPYNRVNIEERSGKSYRTIGYTKFYELRDDQNNVEVDLHENNRLLKHSFYFFNANKEINIKMIAPKSTSFIFENGTQTKKYDFVMKSNDTFEFSMYLKPDYSNEVYKRIYRFGHK